MSTLTEIIDQDYNQLIHDLKNQIKRSRTRTFRTVNTELIHMYWSIGKELLFRQNIERWGSKYLEQVSRDLKMEFPSMTGFSTRNLKYMRVFAQAYPDLLSDQNLKKSRKGGNNKPIGQQAVAQLPWGHLVDLLTKIKCRQIRGWYIQQANQEGWSRNELNLMIKSDLYHRQETTAKITNFAATLPVEQSRLAKEVFKDPYCFEFLNIQQPIREYDIENALINNIRDFLLQLGRGFAFVGSQYHLQIGETDFYIDCLFYNYQMRCFVVIELKTGKFKAEHTGQLNLYLTGVDKLLKTPNDNPTIGLILCESKDQIVAQYAVDGMTRPMGISEYELGQVLTNRFKSIYSKTKEGYSADLVRSEQSIE